MIKKNRKLNLDFFFHIRRIPFIYLNLSKLRPPGEIYLLGLCFITRDKVYNIKIFPLEIISAHHQKMKFVLALILAFAIFIPNVMCLKAVITGGGVATTNADLYGGFVDLATSGGESYIGIITAGINWNVAESTANTIARRFERTYGATRVEWLPFHKDNGNSCFDTTLANKIRSMTGVFFNGGDVNFYNDCFFRNGVTSPALTTMRAEYRSNRLAIMGSSAGTLVLQDTPMLRTRESYNSLVLRSLYTANGGFAFFDYGFLDVHFSGKGRHGRLIRLIEDLHQYSQYGFGIDDDTGMIITGNTFRVAGTGGVYIFDVSGAINTSGKRFGVNNVRATLLTLGDSYNLATKVATFASYKNLLTASNQNDVTAKMTSDIFKPGMFTTLTTRLFLARRSTSTYGLTAELSPRFRLNFRESAQSAGYMGKTGGKTYYGYRNLFIDIFCHSNC